MFDVEGHLVENLFVCNSPDTGNTTVWTKVRLPVNVSEMHFTSFAFQTEGFPAETLQHLQDSL